MEHDVTNTDVWPDGVPTSYWNSDAIETITGAGQANFLNMLPSWQFAVAAGVGGVIVLFFATKMFNTASFDPEATRYRILSRLQPKQLRRRDLARRAYLNYASLMLLIFLGFTFFGELILGMLNAATETAGFTINVGTIKFDSPNWPITIAFGMVGLIPMIWPIAMSERFIRRWVHRRAGIPVRLHDRANELINLMDDANRTEDYQKKQREEQEKLVPSWLLDAIPDQRSIWRTMEQFDHLNRMRDWLMDERSRWPSAEERQDLIAVEQSELADAAVTINEFHTLLRSDWTPQEEKESDLHAHRTRLIEKWQSLSENIRVHRDELVAILVVYAERDEEYDKIESAELRGHVRAVFEREPLVPGPEKSLVFLVLPIVFCVYFLAVATGWHPKLGTVDLRPGTIFLTALLESVKFALLFILPLLLVMAYRAGKHEDGKWNPRALFRLAGNSERQFGRVCLIAFLVPAVGLLLLGSVWAAVIAPGSDRLLEIFLLNDAPFALVYPSLAFISLIAIPLVVFEADATKSKERVWNSAPAWFWGGIAAVLVALALYGHMWFWLKMILGSAPEICLWSKTCFLTYSGLNFLIYPLTAFASIALLMPKPVRRGFWRPAGAMAAAASVVLLGLFVVMATPSGAAEMETQPPKATQKIYVGFREDAEPFSYLIERENDHRFTGYIADLCHKIFDGSRYEIVADPIAPGDRFDRLKPGSDGDPEETFASSRAEDGKDEMLTESSLVPTSSGPTPEAAADGQDKPALDMICDPTTLRYSLDDGREKGVFSPIVFITGVSYLARRVGTNEHLTLAYVRRTSAEEVAMRLCRENGFRLYDNEKDRKEEWEKHTETLKDYIETGKLPDTLKPYEKDKIRAQEFVFKTDSNRYLRPESECLSPRDMNNGVFPIVVRKAGGADCTGVFKSYEICSFDSHAALIRWFCSADEGDKSGRIYIGDRDIIVGKLEAWRKKKLDCSGDIETDKGVLTYEPYALVISRADGDLIAHVQRRIYEIFSNRSEALGLFTTHFEGKQLSVPLANLFLINAVEQPECLQVQHEDRCPRLSAQHGAER